MSLACRHFPPDASELGSVKLMHLPSTLADDWHGQRTAFGGYGNIAIVRILKSTRRRTDRVACVALELERERTVHL